MRTLIRNIPAYAGKTFALCLWVLGFQEHPRVCGENKSQVVRRHALRGTSPRMRGKLCYRKILRRYARNIPAYAGKTNEGSQQGRG